MFLPQNFLSFLGIACLAVAITGCSSESGIKVTGQLLKDGQPLIPASDEAINVEFSTTAGSPKSFGIVAKVQSDGTFTVPTGPKQVMPSGNYQITVTFGPTNSSNPEEVKKYQDKNPSRVSVSIVHQFTTDATQKIKVDVSKKTVAKSE